jgi:hypothetical protein
MRMMKQIHIRQLPVPAVLLAGIIGISPLNADAAEQAGVSAAVKGEVQLTRLPEVVGRQISSGEPIFLTDRIQSGPASGMQILLLDETIFTIGPSSELVIDEFVYDPETDTGRVSATVAKGVFRFVTGRVAAKKPDAMKVRTPFGTIGIRGTIVAGEVTATGADVVLLGPGGETNTAERVGRIEVSNDRGSVTVTRPGFGTSLGGGEAAPTSPAQVPPERISALTNAIARPTEQQGGAENDSDQASGQGSGGNRQNQSGNQQQSASSSESGPGQQTAGSSRNANASASATPAANPSAATAPSGGQAAPSQFSAGSGGGFAGQAQASAIGGVETLGNVQGSINNQNNAGEQVVQQIRVTDGVSSLNDLNTIASGRYHYDQTITMSSGGTYRFIAEIDFGERRAGGGTSRVVINSAHGGIGNITKTLEADSFDSIPNGLANFGQDDNGVDIVNCASGANACSLDVSASLLNKDGIVAGQMSHSVEVYVTASPAVAESGSGITNRVPGTAP